MSLSCKSQMGKFTFDYAQNIEISDMALLPNGQILVTVPVINRETYERQLDKLNEQIMLSEMQEREAKLEAYDVDAVPNFAEHVMLNASRLWTEFSNDQKHRLQRVLFPQGVTFAGGEYGTAKTCLFFNLLQPTQLEKTSLATLPGIEPGLPP